MMSAAVPVLILFAGLAAMIVAGTVMWGWWACLFAVGLLAIVYAVMNFDN